uniref:Uncharacterized protein n=1 Tax=Trichinella nativa TaxID=6335 RepID=A0A0V1KJ81_9BILA
MELGDSYGRIRRLAVPKGIGMSHEEQQNQLIHQDPRHLGGLSSRPF